MYDTPTVSVRNESRNRGYLLRPDATLCHFRRVNLFDFGHESSIVVYSYMVQT